MYPVDETTYYHAASPIKIFEYTAAGKPVVVPHIREAERIGFDNLVFTDPTPEAYAEGLLEALDSPPASVPEIRRYDWQSLSDRLDRFLSQVTGCPNPRKEERGGGEAVSWNT